MPRKLVLLKRLVLVLIAAAILIGAAHLAFRPPSLEGRTESEAVAASMSTRLGRVALTPPADRSGPTGVLPLIDGPEAFAARVALIRGAEAALDVQYYIWQRDATGLILLDEFRRAAERGVRIRLLLDDHGVWELDRDLAALDALPGVEVRLFNPFILRRPKMLGFAFDFVRLNRRMHNKSLTADGAASILGGRNIGDVYFAFGEGVHYVDTDVLVAGKAAADVGSDFDRYWASGSAYPVDRILSTAGDTEGVALARMIADARAAMNSAEGRLYAAKLLESGIVERMASGDPGLEWTRVTVVSDDPAKGLGKAEFRDLLFPQLMALLAQPDRSVDLVSAYFIPGRQFTEALANLATSGKRVRILTNSLDATDVTIVHSSYVDYRPDLLRAGVELYELKPAFSPDDEGEVRGPAGSSRASLHSKTLAVDEERIFIGSFNFDPRSLHLNTEMGVLIESPRMARGLANAFETVFTTTSFRPMLTEDGSITWQEITGNGAPVLHADEPGSDLLSRLFFSVLGLLPIEWLL